jgi:hypothetical protein
MATEAQLVEVRPLGAKMLHLTLLKGADTFNPDEIALYDRQIRLWGVKAQEKYGLLVAQLSALS